jgi:hypothetical protein
MDLELTNNVKEIESGAFSCFDGFKDIYINDLKSWCSFKRDLSIPRTSISEQGDKGKIYLQNIPISGTLKFPKDIDIIEDYCFYDYKELNTI